MNPKIEAQMDRVHQAYTDYVNAKETVEDHREHWLIENQRLYELLKDTNLRPGERPSICNHVFGPAFCLEGGGWVCECIKCTVCRDATEEEIATPYARRTVAYRQQPQPLGMKLRNVDDTEDKHRVVHYSKQEQKHAAVMYQKLFRLEKKGAKK